MAKKTTPTGKSTALAANAGAATTVVGVAAEFEIGSTVIPISAADLANVAKNGLQFSLPPGQIIKITGSVQDFIGEAGKTFDPSFTPPDLKNLPKPFNEVLTTQIAIEITQLSLNSKTGDAAIAVGFTPEQPLPGPGPLSFIKLKKVALSIERTGAQGPAKP